MGEVVGSDAEQRIFISYRRSDCQSQANGLHDGLRHRLDQSKIFMDIDSIPPGADFEEHIREEIEQCDVVLVLIGDEWLDPQPDTDIRRIDESNDFVRLEVESSLKSDHVRVIPVLVEGAQMPRREELPESIQRLARLNAFELSDSRWSTDLERLTQQLREVKAPLVKAQPTMGFADVDADAVRYVISLLPQTFKTKDLSEHPAVLATHTDVSQVANYHTIMGRFLMQNRETLGLQAPDRPVDDRGSIWRKVPPPPAAHPAPARIQAATARAVSKNVVPAKTRRGATPVMGWLMIALPFLTCGLAAFAPPLWAASQRKYDQPFKRKMYALASTFALLSIVGMALFFTAPSDASGTPTGAAADIGGLLFIILVPLAAVVVAILFRNPGAPLPGTADEMERRGLRDQYRKLIRTDRALAASMLVGRPDMPRQYDDGGLLDLNNLSAQALERHGPLSAAEAAQVVEVRQRLGGGFSDLNEVLAYVSLSEGTTSRLRDVAAFV